MSRTCGGATDGPPPVQVMRNSDRSRRDAPPVLKSGGKWPCVTLHVPPDVTPVQQLTGSAAASSEALCGALDAAAAQHAPPSESGSSEAAGEESSDDGDTAAAQEQALPQDETPGTSAADKSGAACKYRANAQARGASQRAWCAQSRGIDSTRNGTCMVVFSGQRARVAAPSACYHKHLTRVACAQRRRNVR